MRRGLALWMIVALSLSIALAVATAEGVRYSVMMVDNCEEWVSLRQKPDTGSRRLAKVPLFAIVTDAEWEPGYGDFIRCAYDGQYGYILSRYLAPWADPEAELNARFDSALGFSFEYDASVMTVEADMSEDGQSLMIAPEDSVSAVYLEIMTPQSVGVSSEAFLEQNASMGAVREESVTEYGAYMRWFQKTASYNADIVETYYAVGDDERFVVAFGTWPAAENLNWSTAYSALLRSLRFDGDAPVWADWAEATPAALAVDPGGEYVTIMARAAVTDVQLLALDFRGMDADGSALFDTAVLARRDALTPEEPLVVRIAFPGDIPTRGVSFTDPGGETRRFALQISGRDGGLVMEEF